MAVTTILLDYRLMLPCGTNEMAGIPECCIIPSPLEVVTSKATYIWNVGLASDEVQRYDLIFNCIFSSA